MPAPLRFQAENDSYILFDFVKPTGLECAPMESFTTLRKRRKKSQVWLAARLGVHPTTISQYEHGRTMPKLRRFALLAEALDVSPRRLLDALEESHRLRSADRAPVMNLQEVRERRESSAQR